MDLGKLIWKVKVSLSNKLVLSKDAITMVKNYEDKLYRNGPVNPGDTDLWESFCPCPPNNSSNIQLQLLVSGMKQQ